jgi:chromosome segregation ATPase
MARKATPEPTPEATAEPTPAPFAVPSLADVDDEYGELVRKRNDLRIRQSDLTARRRTLQAEIIAAGTAAPQLRAGVAELLGEAGDSVHAAKGEMAKINRQLTDLEDAIKIMDKRIDAQRGKASLKVCDAVRTEYASCVKAMCDAMRVLDEAHVEYRALTSALEDQNVAWLSLEPMNPPWLGDATDDYRNIQLYLGQAREAGYDG